MRRAKFVQLSSTDSKFIIFDGVLLCRKKDLRFLEEEKNANRKEEMHLE